jgi:hypothetical protein
VAGGKRAGARPKRAFRPALLLLALGITLCVVAWGYLVFAAIDFGGSARGGDTDAWWFLGIASLGAVACLFVGLMLIARLSRVIGLTRGPAPKSPKETVERKPPKGSSGSAPGGRRAAR